MLSLNVARVPSGSKSNTICCRHTPEKRVLLSGKEGTEQILSISKNNRIAPKAF